MTIPAIAAVNEQIALTATVTGAAGGAYTRGEVDEIVAYARALKPGSRAAIEAIVGVLDPEGCQPRHDARQRAQAVHNAVRRHDANSAVAVLARFEALAQRLDEPAATAVRQQIAAVAADLFA